MAVALLVAAGSGERLGAGGPKAFVVLAGRPMLEWSLEALRAAGIDHVVVAAPPDVAAAGDEARARAGRDDRAGRCRPLGVRPRGAGRRAARRRRRPRCGATARDARPLHGGARRAGRRRLRDRRSAAAPTPSRRPGRTGSSPRTLDRSRLWAIQTPQAFRRAALERALAVGDDVLAQATDDAWLVERTGGTVRVVESTPANLKVTTPHDLRIAELLLADRLPRPSAP